MTSPKPTPKGLSPTPPFEGAATRTPRRSNAAWPLVSLRSTIDYTIARAGQSLWNLGEVVKGVEFPSEHP